MIKKIIKRLNNQITYSIAITFLLIFMVKYFTPFHSDDFSYGQMGLSFARHFAHYKGWSGRLVADYSSAAILLIKNRCVVSIIMSLFATVLCFIIADLPNKLFKTEFKWWQLFIVVCLYWVSNPNLGQICFWTVGACNYLVTNFCIALFLYLFIIYKNNQSFTARCTLFLLSICAGCTNENTCLTLVYICVAMYLIFMYRKTDFDRKGLGLYVLGVALGSAVLLLAPGNYARSAHKAFAGWHKLSLSEKIVSHINRLKNEWYRFWADYLCCVPAFVLLMRKKEKHNATDRLIWSLLFLSAAVCAYVLMVAAPSMPPRSWSGIQFYLLFAVSFTLDPTLYTCLTKIAKRVVLLVIVIFGITFVYSYILVLNSYMITTYQEQVRNSHINFEKLLYGREAAPTIPSYYFMKLLTDRDKFDMYHSGAMAGWFGVKSVDLVWIEYDCSAKERGKQAAVVNDTELEDVKIFVVPKTTIFDKGTIMLESSSDINRNIAIMYYAPRAYEASKITLGGKIKLKNKYYVGATIKGLQNVENVRVIYDDSTR